MNTKILTFLFILIVLAGSVYGIEECTPITPPENVPCFVTSTWNFTAPCSGYNSTIFNSTGTFIWNYTLYDFGDSDLCRFDWNLTTEGSYYYIVSNGETGNIIVEVNKVDINITGSLLSAFLVLIWIGLLITTLAVKGKNGQTIGVLNVITGFMGFFAGMSMLTLNMWIGILIMFGALTIMAGKMME